MNLACILRVLKIITSLAAGSITFKRKLVGTLYMTNGLISAMDHESYQCMTLVPWIWIHQHKQQWPLRRLYQQPEIWWNHWKNKNKKTKKNLHMYFLLFSTENCKYSAFPKTSRQWEKLCIWAPVEMWEFLEAKLSSESSVWCLNVRSWFQKNLCWQELNPSFYLHNMNK